MKVSFRLRKRACAGEATALFLPSASLADLLARCARVGGGALQPIYAVPGGFLIELEASRRTGSLPVPTPDRQAACPTGPLGAGTLRLRALVPNLLVPADAELVPGLLDDEAPALVRGRGLVFLPGGGVLAFDPARPLTAADLLIGTQLPRRPWRPLPDRPARPERLREVVLDRPDDAPDLIVEAGGESIGGEAPRPPAAGPAATAAGRAAAGAGQGLVWLGGLLGWRRLAEAGARLVEGAARLVPRISESVLGRQEAALRELLRRFREGDPEEALRRALPLGAAGDRGSAVAGDARLPRHDLGYRLGDLLGGGAGGSLWLGGGDVRAELEAEYRKAAEAATRRGDYRRAAFVYGKLLQDYRLAALVLARGGLHHDAAVLYLEKLGDPLAAAREFEAVGEVDRAVYLYRQQGEHALAGDLLRRAGEDELAVAEYHLAAARLAAAGSHLEAGELFLKRADRPDLAALYLAEGWRRRPQGGWAGCLLRLAPLYAARPKADELLALADEADAFFARPGNDHHAGQFYNELASQANAPPLERLRDDLHDRALVGLATKLRQRAEAGSGGTVLAATLFGASGLWAAGVVSDAGAALRGARAARGSEPRPAALSRTSTLGGRVSAACAAPQTGDLYLGFAGGAVVCFQARTGRVAEFPPYPWPVVALATDATGHEVVILRGNEGETAHLRGYSGWECHHAVAGCRTLAVQGSPQLTPVAAHEGQSVLGLWDGARLSLLAGPEFAPQDRIEPPFPAAEFTAALVLAAGAALAGPSTVLFDAGGGVWFVDHTGLATQAAGHNSLVRIDLGWAPARAPHGIAVPPAWAVPRLPRLEVAGLSRDGDLCWSALDLFGPPVQSSDRRFNSDAGLRYRAAALLGPGRVAGVTATQVRWLRCGPTRFTLWATTRADLADAVACFHSPQTGELLVVCQDGDVVRVPVPG